MRRRRFKFHKTENYSNLFKREVACPLPECSVCDKLTYRKVTIDGITKIIWTCPIYGYSISYQLKGDENDKRGN